MTQSRRHLTTLNLEPFLRSTIGVPYMFENMLTRAEQCNNGNYPPYNIIQINENQYCIEVAVAGFTKENIAVKVEDGELIIASRPIDNELVDTEDELDEVNYLHQGISARRFERTFALADHIEVSGATVENGILKVNLDRNVPENLKPKEIEIT